MPRLLSILLILGLLLPSLSLASEPPAEVSADDTISVPVYLFADDTDGLLVITPLTDELFVWAYAPDGSAMNLHSAMKVHSGEFMHAAVQLESTLTLEFPQVKTTFRYDPSGRRVLLKEANGSEDTFGPMGAGGFGQMGAGPTGGGAGAMGAGAGPIYRTIHYPTAQFTDLLHDASQRIHIEAAGMTVGTIEKTLTATNVFHTHADHLSSTRNVTDAAGVVIETADYEAFGSLKNHTASTAFKEDRKFTSHELDEGTSYTYAKARYLNTDVGRFISEDRAFIYAGDSAQFEAIAGVPFEAYLADPQLQNSYSYARNNPVKFVDPTGEMPTAVAGALIGGGIGLAAQAISDAFRGNFSGWNAYAGAAAGGAVQGALWGSGAKLLDLAFGGAASGFAEGVVREGLDYMTGDPTGFQTKEVGKDIGVSALTGILGGKLSEVFGPAVDIPGVTTGRNSYPAIFKQIMTKLRNGTIGGVSAGTIGKMGTARAMDSTYEVFLEGILNGSQNPIGQQYYMTPSGAIVTPNGKLIMSPSGTQP